MPQNRRIYLLDPKKLSPETIAVTFAKTSRSPQAFDEIAEELSDERSADFHEKWVVGYGHSSVAEHAVLHIAVENVSRLAIESLESNRLASYTEKSSRYQIWDADHFHIPDEFEDGHARKLYTQTCTDLFNAYEKAFQIIQQSLMETLPAKDSESERGFNMRVRSASADVCRYFLPAASLANVGISINARALEHAITKTLSHPLQEVRAIGEEIKRNALKHVPTLVKYANPNPHLIMLNQDVFPTSQTGEKNAHSDGDWCVCVDHDQDGEDKILAALMYRTGSISMQQAKSRAASMNAKEKAEECRKYTASLGVHDQPVREFEYAEAGFDLVLDQGAYFELKRHRMMTQTVQKFTPHLGFAIPKLITDNGLSDLFIKMMRQAHDAYEILAQKDTHAAAYVLPNAYNRRVLLQMNMRSAIHLIKLRCAENAHFAIRRPTLRMAVMLRERFPMLETLLSPCSDETWQGVEQDYFSKTQMY